MTALVNLTIHANILVFSQFVTLKNINWRITVNINQLFPESEKKQFIYFITSMLISILVYSSLLGFWFSFGFVVMLLIHEMGHFVATKKLKVNCTWPLFIPFLGAIINMFELPPKKEEAIIGISGPLAGITATTILFWVYYFYFPSNMLLAQVCFFSYFLNLINLIPIRPLDGGRVTHLIGDWLIYIGYLIIITLVVLTQYPMLAFFGLLVLSRPDRPNYITLTTVYILSGLFIYLFIPYLLLINTWMVYLISVMVFVAPISTIMNNHIAISEIKRLKKLRKDILNNMHAIEGKYHPKDDLHSNISDKPPVSNMTKILWIGFYLLLAEIAFIHASYFFPMMGTM